MTLSDHVPAVMHGEDLQVKNDQLRALIIELRAQIAALEQLADTDTLTPLPNRRYFEREVTRVAARVARHGTPAAVIFVDVDRLKAINDQHGHSIGDAALIHVAELLRREVRASDSVARIGGDEFAIMLDQLDEDAATAKAATLAALCCGQPLLRGGLSLSIPLSLGMTMIAADDTIVTVLARADAQMYAARAAQRSAR